MKKILPLLVVALTIILIVMSNNSGDNANQDKAPADSSRVSSDTLRKKVGNFFDGLGKRLDRGLERADRTLDATDLRGPDQYWVNAAKEVWNYKNPGIDYPDRWRNPQSGTVITRQDTILVDSKVFFAGLYVWENNEPIAVNYNLLTKDLSGRFRLLLENQIDLDFSDVLLRQNIPVREAWLANNLYLTMIKIDTNQLHLYMPYNLKNTAEPMFLTPSPSKK